MLYTETDVKSLLKAVARDILIETLDFDRVQKGCVFQARNFQGSKCLVIPFGPTHAANSLASMLKAGTDLDVIVRLAAVSEGVGTSSHPGDHGSSKQCKLAIVGMSGRFPDAASHEKLWELLEKGLDVHREVMIITPDGFLR